MAVIPSVKSIFPKPLYLGAATRSPIGKFGGSLLRFSAPQLAALALTEARERAPEVKKSDWVFLGHARQAGCAPNPARQALIYSGLPDSVPAFTINHACASGISAVFSGLEKIALGQATSVWAGGTESMSNTPYFLTDARWGLRMGNKEVVDGMVKDGFFCPMADMLMGATVDKFIAGEKGISRDEQDAFACESQRRASQAWTNGLFNDEVFAIPEQGKGRKKLPGLDKDEHLREGTTVEKLGKLSPVFDLKNGTVTAGNSSGITDGSAFLHISDKKQSHTQVEVIDYETVALDPKLMGLGPVAATENILKRQGLAAKDLESVEINEAFAAQVIGCQRVLKIPTEKLNPKGGSIAIGHPIGATGARIIVTLIHSIKNKSGALGLATLCVSGGQGVAILVKAV